MERRSLTALVCLVALMATGCGGSDSTARRTNPGDAAIRQDGVGMTAPIKAYVVAHRVGPAHIEPGPHRLSASPCYGGGNGGLAVIGLFSDVPAPRCLRVSPGERILVVNRSGAFFKRDRSVSFLRLGDYTARIGPQEAALFPARVGTYLGYGLHAFGGRSGTATPGVLVVRPSCNRHTGIDRPFSRCF